MHRSSAISAVCFTIVFYPIGKAQNRTEVRVDPDQRTCPFIVSPKHPTDSLGETVYEVQGKDQLDIPAVPGACVIPVMISTPKIKFPKELKEARYSALVDVLAVVTAHGDIVDAKAPDGADARATGAAIDAVTRFKFKPATLDGKPVAMSIRIPVNFKLRKFWGGFYAADRPQPSANP